MAMFRLNRPMLMALILGLGGLAAQQAAVAKDQETSDGKFVQEAASGGMLEVQLGQLASQNADSPDVRKFGERMVSDHTQANKELMTIAQNKGWTVSRELSSKHQAMYDKMKVLKGGDFDRAYMKHMVKDHEEDIADFTKEANDGKDEQVKSFASKTLPTLKEHLKMARDVATKVGVTTNEK